MQTAKAMLGKAVEVAKTVTAKTMEDERRTYDLLFGEGVEQSINMGDQKLNQLAALTYNSDSCERMFALIERALIPTENIWKTIYRALLLLHTIVLYGSELAVDMSIKMARHVNNLVEYNSATVKRKGILTTKTGGQDFGAPVRMVARQLNPILLTDQGIRQARREARDAAGGASMVPIGQTAEEVKGPVKLTFGQGLETSMGAGFDLAAVPGMYENRPERYFDKTNDPRKRPVVTGDAQATRDVRLL
jgi:ENTH domain